MKRTRDNWLKGHVAHKWLKNGLYYDFCQILFTNCNKFSDAFQTNSEK